LLGYLHGDGFVFASNRQVVGERSCPYSNFVTARGDVGRRCDEYLDSSFFIYFQSGNYRWLDLLLPVEWCVHFQPHIVQSSSTFVDDLKRYLNRAAGIDLIEGYDPAQLDPAPDLVVVGNAMSRGNPAVEYVLNKGLPYVSGPQWLADHVLQGRWVLAVAGTHGKTTTTSMLLWILDQAGFEGYQPKTIKDILTGFRLYKDSE